MLDFITVVIVNFVWQEICERAIDRAREKERRRLRCVQVHTCLNKRRQKANKELKKNGSYFLCLLARSEQTYEWFMIVISYMKWRKVFCWRHKLTYQSNDRPHRNCNISIHKIAVIVVIIQFINGIKINLFIFFFIIIFLLIECCSWQTQCRKNKKIRWFVCAEKLNWALYYGNW